MNLSFLLKFQEQNQDLKERSKLAQEKIDQYSGLKDFLDGEKKRILNDAKTEAKSLVKNANKKIERTIREIKEQKAEKTK